ncbi:hypothetical protein BGZ83_010967 [Gryganskiella cystojenkinii]|nr:hypothetical protein BGZ83_010967 [Gryganskiella cystojenkinii]
MRITATSWMLTLSVVLATTSQTNIVAHPSPSSPSPNIDFPREAKPDSDHKNTRRSLYQSISYQPQYQQRRLELKENPSTRTSLIKRGRGPRRLLNEKRAGGLLDSLVGGVAPPTSGAPAAAPPSPEVPAAPVSEPPTEDDNDDDSDDSDEPSSSPEPSDEPTSTSDEPTSSSTTDEPTTLEPSSDPVTTTTSITTDDSSSSDEPSPEPTQSLKDDNNNNGNDNAESTLTTPRPKTSPTDSMTGAQDEVLPTGTAHQETVVSGNKMAVTIGAVIVALVCVVVIGIWIFRKWKLSPSRQFKSKIASGGIAGGAYDAESNGASGSAYRSHDDREEYTSHDDLFHPAAHESALAMAAAYNDNGQPSAVAASVMQHQDLYQQYQQDQYYDPNYASYNNYDGAAAEVAGGAGATHHQNRMSLASSDLGLPVTNAHSPEYTQYRYPDESYDNNYQPQNERNSECYPHSPTPPERAVVIGGLPATRHNSHGYGSEDYSQNNHFLRELRE